MEKNWANTLFDFAKACLSLLAIYSLYNENYMPGILAMLIYIGLTLNELGNQNEH